MTSSRSTTASRSTTVPGVLRRSPFSTGDDLQGVHDAADLEAQGRPAEALRCLVAAPALVGSPQWHRLGLLTELGEEAPGWLWSRWCVAQAYERGDRGAALATAGPESSEGVDGLPPAGPETVAAELRQRDWVRRQIALYDRGGLRGFLDERARPRLIERADSVSRWSDAPMGGYRLEAQVDRCLVLTDLGSGRRVDVLDLGLAEEQIVGAHLLGRVVSTSVGPGRMLEGRPLPLDPGTARRVAEEPEGWVRSLPGGGVRRVPSRVFADLDESALLCDLSLDAWMGLLGQADLSLTAGAGEGRIGRIDLARRALEAVLEVAPRLGPRLTVSRHTVAMLVLEPGLDAVVRAHLLSRANARAWRLLAGVLPEPAHRRCRRYADLSEGTAEVA